VNLYDGDAPEGVRPPDGIVWSHAKNDFWLIEDRGRVWSRSMLKEAGIDVDNEDIEPIPQTIPA